MGNNGRRGVDTLAAVRAMEAAGVERGQAKAIAATVRDAVMHEMATKTDIGDVRVAIASMETRLLKVIFTVAVVQTAVIVTLVRLL